MSTKLIVELDSLSGPGRTWFAAGKNLIALTEPPLRPGNYSFSYDTERCRPCLLRTEPGIWSLTFSEETLT